MRVPRTAAIQEERGKKKERSRLKRRRSNGLLLKKPGSDHAPSSALPAPPFAHEPEDQAGAVRSETRQSDQSGRSACSSAAAPTTASSQSLTSGCSVLTRIKRTRCPAAETLASSSPLF